MFPGAHPIMITKGYSAPDWQLCAVKHEPFVLQNATLILTICFKSYFEKCYFFKEVFHPQYYSVSQMYGHYKWTYITMNKAHSCPWKSTDFSARFV